MFKMWIKAIVRTVIYLGLASIFFFGLVNFLKFPIKKDIVVTESSYNIQDKKQEISENLEFYSDLEKQQLKAEADRYKEKLVKGDNIEQSQSQKDFTKSFSEKYIFFNYIFNNNNQVIPMLYLLIFSTFLIQIVLLSFSNYYTLLSEYYMEERVRSFFLYTSEWTINAPPTLGVVGTIFAFGMVVSNMSDVSSLSTVIKENFANAALTTIIGGVVYVLNLFVNIFTTQNLVKKD